jgi:hypothetical protein
MNETGSPQRTLSGPCPYLQRYSVPLSCVKFGGNAMERTANAMAEFARDIVLMKNKSYEPRGRPRRHDD